MIKHGGYATKLAKANVRFARGRGHLSFVVEAFKMFVFYGGFVLIIKSWLGIELPQWVGIPIVMGYFLSCYMIGWIDQRIGFWRTEASYSAKELNPFFEELDKKVDKILKKVYNYEKNNNNYIKARR